MDKYTKLLLWALLLPLSGFSLLSVTLGGPWSFSASNCDSTRSGASDDGSFSSFPISSDQPTEVSFSGEEQVSFDKDLESFACFAWRDFIALNWPAHPVEAGVPDQQKYLGDKSNRVVWQTWKSMQDVFPEDAEIHRPKEWSRNSPTRMLEKPKLVDVNQNGTLRGSLASDKFNLPLIAQNKTFVRYQVLINRIQFERVLRDRLYLSKNLDKLDNNKCELPDQSVSVKAAWMVMPNDESVRSRFYCTEAKIANWCGDRPPEYSDAVVGLVGLHIVHKTPKRRAWVWETFEHMDNVDLGPVARGTPSFNDGVHVPRRSAGVMFGDIPLQKHLIKDSPLPSPSSLKLINIFRQGLDIPLPIKRINANLYRKLPVPWKYYQLVGVQWPTKPGDAPEKFLPNSDLQPELNVANTTIETYTQPSSCMGCHIIAPGQVFYLSRRALPRDEEREDKLTTKLRDAIEHSFNRSKQ